MIVTRFPPSPTGYLHVGGLRTALYNYLLARQQKGRFILRIEDTDRARYVEGAVENIIETLNWASIDHDEGPDIGGPNGPYTQSERLKIYKEKVQFLVEQGEAYHCFCTAERLTEMRERQQAHKEAPKYDRHCLRLAAEEVAKKLNAGEPSVIRHKVPGGKKVSWKDLVRDEVSFDSDLIDDQVLMKSDGYPTYHLANVIDDHSMEVTHVIRGEEWLSSTPKHILLYEAFGWEIPQFAHLPLLLNKDRSKLSKRQGDVAADDYRKKGYLPEALINFIALLGWHPGGDETQEIFSMEELIEKFSLEKVHKGGAVFDLEKLDWINWQWRRRKFDELPGEYEDKLLNLVENEIPANWRDDAELLKRCLKTVAEKVIKEPSTTVENLSFYFKEKVTIDAQLIANEKMKVDLPLAKNSLEKAFEALSAAPESSFDDEEALKTLLLELVEKLGIKNGQLLWPMRVALTGEQFSPGVFELLWALGKERSLERLKSAAESL
ncbi:glutamate--tRNA ligase [Candidatus Peregrinibacteria bacterium CG_4_9_14_0_2_um_filter_53_11]|nr:MAG: glutamate--tRNA ligase [Candidatus Peregrinibacteria bacterium CG_4_9_14_0_2_um_filter_53_11]